tara:strand:- start:42794 stop:43528 length:735 start_codon:yes stop_codon:yes gene_type:complete
MKEKAYTTPFTGGFVFFPERDNTHDLNFVRLIFFITLKYKDEDKHMVIGLAGVAGCGKDTFFDVLGESMSVKRVSLADALKQEANEWTLKHYGINAVTCSREDKEKIRPFLVLHAGMKRDTTNGRHWIDLVSRKIAINNSDYTTVITDIRFNEYENDEVSWLKNELNGKLIHIRQWVGRPDPNEGVLERIYKTPANSVEAMNDPKLQEAADYRIDIRRVEGTEEDVKAAIRPKVEKFIKWINNA